MAPDIRLCNDSKSEVGRYYSVLLNRAVARLPAIPWQEPLRRRLMIDIFDDNLMTVK
jgi:hypothetical protein